MNDFNLWLYERPSHGTKRWVKFGSYPTKAAAKVARDRLIGGTITNQRLRVLRADKPAPLA